MRRATGSAGSSTTTTTTTNSPTSLFMTLRVPNRDELESTRNQMQAFAESDEGSDFASLPLLPGDQERTTVRDAFGMARTDPGFQELVTSITTDPGIWQAVMDNPVVQNVLNSVAARELLDHSGTSFTSKTDRKLLNADFPWGHGYINNPPEKKN